MRHIILLFFTMTLFSLSAQPYKIIRTIVPASLSFVSGASWGLHEVLEHNNDKFFKRFPGASRKFWGRDSWRNKYIGFDPDMGRNSVPIWFTDGKHLTASASQVFAFGAGFSIVFGEKRKWWHYVLDCGISFAAYSAGNGLTRRFFLRHEQ